jgi:hypothetical protein
VILRWRKPPRDVDHITVTVRREGAGGAARVTRSVGRQLIVRHLVNGVTYRFVVVTWDKARNRSKGVILRARPVRELLLTPKTSERVTRPPVLRWAPSRGAGYYNVQLWRGTVKVLSAWPTRPRLQLTASWVFDGTSRKLTPGVYRWYVWPGLGAKAVARYGSMLGTRVFIVAPAV